MKKIIVLVLFAVTTWLLACRKDNPVVSEPSVEWDQTPYIIQYPSHIKPANQIISPAYNPLTKAGVALGRKLFYDPILSANNTQSCASCHNQRYAFTDPNFAEKGEKFSKGIHGDVGNRNSMPLFNLAYWELKSLSKPYLFFWDGRAPDLERQVFGPITNPIEMASKPEDVLNKLQNHPEYPRLFKKAFGTDSVYIFLVQRAIAQFMRTMISFGSRYDQYLASGNINILTEQEARGMIRFFGVNDNGTSGNGDCFHCHGGDKSLFLTDFSNKNNGLDGYTPPDSGLFKITNNPADLAKFKVPSLRNIALTAPYMHDSRFTTLEEVLNFYNSGIKVSSTVDPNISKHAGAGGIGLNLGPLEKADIVAFLKCLTDSTFITNPELSQP